MSRHLGPIISMLQAKQLVGIQMEMSLANNTTNVLWQRFMPLHKLMEGTVSSDLFSIRIYNEPLNLKSADIHARFIKWAAMEVVDFYILPEGMQRFILPEGLYARFAYYGSSADHSIFNYIYSEWLPNSEYELDNRPHFEILGDKYKNADANSQEDIFIPVKFSDSEKE